MIGAMLETWTNQFEAYPRWLVLISLAVVAALGLWLAAKALKAVLTFLLAIGIVLLAAFAVWCFFNPTGHL